eukprot:656154-Pleurochrysis_carterae.AAC.1
MASQEWPAKNGQPRMARQRLSGAAMGELAEGAVEGRGIGASHAASRGLFGRRRAAAEGAKT